MPSDADVSSRANRERTLNLRSYAILAAVAVRRGFDSASALIRHLWHRIEIVRGKPSKTTEANPHD